jgi:hypothetical protein
MSEEDFKRRIEEKWKLHGKVREKSRIWGGLFLLTAGGLLLARASGVNFPSWFFTGPILLIALGLTVLGL